MPNLSDLDRYQKEEDHKIILSVDLGKQQDFTALTTSEVIPEVRKNKRNQRVKANVINVRSIVRLPLGTDYTRVQDTVHNLFWHDRLTLIHPETFKTIRPTMLVDAGGVGGGIVDNLRKELGVPFIRYQLTRGTSEAHQISKYSFTVPRSTVFGILDGAFHDDCIRIDPRLKLAPVLLHELENLEVERHEETGYVRVVHRQGEHDDLAICLAATAWYAKPRKKNRVRLISDPRVEAKLMGYR